MTFLLWDHDGVLVDTERWYFEATRDTLAEMRIALDEERHLALQAQGRPAWVLAREAGFSEAQIDAARERRNARYQALLRGRPIEIPGVAEVLRELGRDHRMAIVTTSRRADFELIHAERDLVRHFEFVLTVEDYPRAKPAPDPYLAALARFGAAAPDALVLEDSQRGLGAARAAGIDCVIVRNAFTAGQDFTGAWAEVDGVHALPGLLARRAAGESR